MSTVPNSPLNQQHLDQINAALRAIEVAETQIILAKQAHIDVSQQEKQLVDAKDKLRALKNTYFPGSL
jgi:hypothetical protein